MSEKRRLFGTPPPVLVGQIHVRKKFSGKNFWQKTSGIISGLLALLIGLRACTLKLHSQKRNTSEYRDLQALLVLGYCLKRLRADLNEPILRQLVPTLLLVCQMNAGPIHPNSRVFLLEFDCWCKIMQRRIRKIRRHYLESSEEVSVKQRAYSAFTKLSILLQEERKLRVPSDLSKSPFRKS
jgi:hypothetical protein